MDHFHERFDALELQVQTLTQQSRRAGRRLRWWRGLACGLAVLGLLGWGLPSGFAREDAREKDKDQKGLAQRVAALEQLLEHFSREGKEIFIAGANLHSVNGLGSTDCTDDQDQPISDCPNGLGHLIVGYNESRAPVFGEEDIRTGSLSVVVRQYHNFSGFGGLVVGRTNEISGDFASVSGGDGNVASGNFASVSGGQGNAACGGFVSISAALQNTAFGPASSVGGGQLNTASGDSAVVSGGESNTASGQFASVSGGHNRTADGQFDWVAGSLLEDE
jgi:hypothetical protein